jgi:hypothetical protein
VAIGTVPTYLQNASHSASVFRIAQSAAFATGGILASNELPVSQQGTPNMSVVLGPGRGQIVGTSVSPPSGQAWTTQAQYTAYNDANLTLTVAASNPTNPRIDAVYIGVQDSFYSGSTNTAVAGIVTGTPAASPAQPAVPSNSLLLGYIAVAANATTIVTGNISFQASVATLVGAGVPQVAHATAVNRALSAANTFSNPTTATAFPVSADAIALQSTFTKKFASSNLLVRIVVPLNFTSGTAQNMGAQLNIGGTSYQVAEIAVIATSAFVITGELLIPGLAAGSYAVFPTITSTGGAALNSPTGAQVSYSITEVA